MSISLELVNLNQLFTSSPIEPVILNDMSSVTVEDREKIDELTTSSYHQTDVFSNRPSCSCDNHLLYYHSCNWTCFQTDPVAAVVIQ